MCPSMTYSPLCEYVSSEIQVCAGVHTQPQKYKGGKKKISKLVGNNLLFIFPELAKKMGIDIHEFI